MLRLKLSDVRSEEFELLGVKMRLVSKLFDGFGMSYDESSILLNCKLVDAVELDNVDWRFHEYPRGVS